MIELPFNTSEFAEAWQDYLDNKKELHKFEYKNIRSMKTALKKLYRLSFGKEKIAIAMLENSIDGGWKGFFPLQDNDPLIKEYNLSLQNKPKTLAQKMKQDYGIGN